MPCRQCDGEGTCTEQVCGYGHYDAPNERTYTCERCDGGGAEPCEDCGDDSRVVAVDPDDSSDARWYCATCVDEATAEGWALLADARRVPTTVPAHAANLTQWEVVP